MNHIEGPGIIEGSFSAKLEITDAYLAIYCLAQMFAAIDTGDFKAAAFWKEKATEYADNAILSSEVIQ